jgi:hypothetical protein
MCQLPHQEGMVVRKKLAGIVEVMVADQNVGGFHGAQLMEKFASLMERMLMQHPVPIQDVSQYDNEFNFLVLLNKLKGEGYKMIHVGNISLSEMGIANDQDLHFY